MAKRFITRTGEWPDQPRKAKEIIKLLDEGELTPRTEVFDEAAQDWRPLTEVEPFAEHLRREEELRQTLSPEEFAKRKKFRRPVRYVLTGLGIIIVFVAVAFAMATLFESFAEGLGGLPEAPSGDAEPLWRFAVGEAVGGSPCYYDGVVYFGSQDGSVYCVDAVSGEGLWRYDTGGPIIGEVLVVDGRVYVGSCANGVWCLDSATGERLWTFYTGFYVGGGVHFSDGRLYFGCYDHNVYCVDAVDGEEVWRFKTGDWVFATPFVAGGRVFVGSYDDHLYCLEADTGREIWRYEVGGDIKSSPYVWRDKVYFGADDSRLYCLEADSAEPELLWRFRDPELWNYIRSRIVVFDGRVFFGSLNNQIYAVDALTGELLWRHKTTNTVEAGGLVAGELADGREFAVGHSHRRPTVDRPEDIEPRSAYLYIGSANNSLYCLDVADGSLAWFYATQGHVLTDPDFHDGVVYFGSQDGHLYAVRSYPELEAD
ncbi:MAG: PQQ-binding-like beta-propeller repeat protein [Candidatus Coatesbacteria bacterium]|nr:PQQ-binding-like beta-propeller repeat protein [Candidatus Coatesbacteria bacterium]